MKFNKKLIKMMPLMLLVPGIMLLSSKNIGGNISVAKENNQPTLFASVPTTAYIYSENGSEDRLQYLKSSGGGYRKFPLKLVRGTGQEAYCLEHTKKAPNNKPEFASGYSYTTTSESVNVLSALELQTKFNSNRDKDYYVRSLVVYELKGANWMNTALDPTGEGMLAEVKNLVAKAKNGVTTRNVTTSLSPSKVTFTQSGDYYTSGVINLQVNQPSGLKYQATLNGSTVKIANAPSGTKIIRANGSEALNGNIGTDKSFTVKVPKSANTSNITISVESRFEVGVASVYAIKGNNTRQKLALRTTEEITVKSSSQAEVVKKGNLRVVKKNDSGEPLANTSFQVMTTSGVALTGVQTTDSTGVTIFKDVPIGTHVLVETSAPWGYIKSANQSVTVFEGGESTKTVVNVRDRGNFKVIKKDEFGNPLAGAKFQLQLGSTIAKGPLTTNERGEVIFENMPTGGYSLVEVAAPEGYLIDPNQNCQIIEVSSARVEEKVITNKLIRGNIQVTAVDSADGKIKLPGAEFKVYDSSNKLVSTGVTDASGVVMFRDLPYGKYTVQESKAPTGYFLNSKPVEVNITTNGSTYATTIYHDRIRDFSMPSYNVKDSSGKIVGTLEKDKTYSFNVKIISKFLNLTLPSDAVLTSPTIDKFKYAIAVNDGTVNQSISSITTSNLKGTVIASGTRTNIPIKDLSTIWQKIEFKTPNDDSYGEIVFVVEIESAKDGNPNNDRLVVKLPILNGRTDEILITNMEVYPNTNGDALVGNDVNVKLDVSSNSLKTYNVSSKITISGPAGFGTKTLTKPVYGVSAEESGSVYFKFKPTVEGTYTISAEAKIPSSTASTKSETIRVVPPSEPKTYLNATNRNNSVYDTNSYIKTYVKVKKRDKDKVVISYCDEPCQEDENGTKSCPGHKHWTWNDWYYAFVPIKSTKMTGIDEKFNITEIKFRSKLTEDNAKKYPLYISEDGYVDMLNVDSAKYGQVKAGYGFDIKVKTEYTNNLPTVFNRAYSSNKVPGNSRWSEYKVIPHSGTKIPYIYSDIIGEKTVSVDSQVSEYSGVVSVAVPSLSDLIIESPNQLYIKMPDPSNEYYMVNEVYTPRYSDSKVKQGLVMSNTTGVKITNEKYSESKQFEFKKDSSDTMNKRGYYISKEIKDGVKTLSFYNRYEGYGLNNNNRYAGYGLNNNNRLHDRKDIAIKVSGGRYDDVKDSE